MGALMKAFSVKISIDAAPERIWKLLTDAAGYARWNTTVERIEGRIALGEKVTVRAKTNAGRAFPVTVTALDAPRRMVWTGGMPLGLFKGERVFMLDGGEFSMREEYTGLLAPLIGKSIPDLQPGV